MFNPEIRDARTQLARIERLIESDAIMKDRR